MFIPKTYLPHLEQTTVTPWKNVWGKTGSHTDIISYKDEEKVAWLPFWWILIYLPYCQERCIKAGTLTVNYEKVSPDYKLKHNDLLANIVHR